ncbi:uncharacterized protein [Solanum lycopersicum]|uniref:uncharacterized protein n=1 Tax=Solanum lycopersicum TaxID=4081 RepID=UPI0002BC89F0|nr:uncharacterized protein LOC101259770 [Solanum lycopersicum]
MAQAITMQAHAMTAQVNQQNVDRENPPEHSMTDRPRDFTRMYPHIFTGSKNSEDPHDFLDEVHKILVAMGARDTKKAELASYQLKNVSQIWCNMWQDSRTLGGVPVIWELFKTVFLERFFPREIREAKVEEFINVKQGSMTVKEYSLKFVKLSMIAEDLKEECRAAMLHENMELSELMIYVQHVEESRKRKHTRARNRSRQAEENFIRKSSTEIRDKPRFKHGIFHQGESISSKGRHDRNFESRVKRNNEVDTYQERPPCGKCGKLHGGECMMGTNACYSCGKPGYKVKDCTIKRNQEQGAERFNLIVQVKRLQGRNDSSHSSLVLQMKAPMVKSRVSSLN